MADSPDGPKPRTWRPLFDLVLKHVEPPKVGAGGFRMLGTLLEANPYLGRIVTGRVFSGVDQDQRAGQGARPSKAIWSRPAGCRRSSPSAASSARRSTRRSAGDIVAIAGLRKVQRRRHALRARGGRAAARAADRSADAVDDLLRQRQPARRHRRRQGDEPRHPRPPVQGGGGQRRAARRGRAQFRLLHRLGPRRIAACDPDRDDAARGLRARRVAPEGAVPQGRDGRDARADRGSRDRRRRGAFGRRRAEDERAQGRDDRDAPLGRRPPAARLPRADARPDRLSRRACSPTRAAPRS